MTSAAALIIVLLARFQAATVPDLPCIPTTLTPATGAARLCVDDRFSRSLVILDCRSGMVECAIPVAPDDVFMRKGLCYNPVTGRLYGDYFIRDSFTDYIAVFDVDSGRLVRWLPLRNPHSAPTVDEERNLLYLNTQAGLHVLDGRNDSVVRTLPVGQWAPSGTVHFDPKTASAWFASGGWGRPSYLLRYSYPDDAVVAALPGANTVMGWLPELRRAWVKDGSRLLVLDLERDEYVDTVWINSSRYGAAHAGLGRLYITTGRGGGRDTVYVIDARGDSIRARIQLPATYGSEPRVAPDGRHVFVTCETGAFTAIACGPDTVCGEPAQVSPMPYDIACDSATGRVYVSCLSDSTLYVLVEVSGCEADPGLAAGAGLARVRPDPSAGSVRLELPAGMDGRVEVAVIDATGRVRRRLVGKGPVLAWDGFDDGGQPVGAGAYFVRVVTPTGSQVCLLRRLR